MESWLNVKNSKASEEEEKKKQIVSNRKIAEKRKEEMVLSHDNLIKNDVLQVRLQVVELSRLAMIRQEKSSQSRETSFIWKIAFFAQQSSKIDSILPFK